MELTERQKIYLQKCQEIHALLGDVTATEAAGILETVKFDFFMKAWRKIN